MHDHPTRRDFVAATAAGVAGLFAAQGVTRAADNSTATPRDGLRICFFTDSHLPYADSVPHLPNAKFHHQQRIRAAFGKANEFQPDAFVFGGDNVFASDPMKDGPHQPGDDKAGADLAEITRGQFDNWKRVVAEKVSVPHHSVIGNHDIWHARPAGQDSKTLAIATFGMPSRYYSWSMMGWKFAMLDVFHDAGILVDKEQFAWLEKELAGDQPVCVVTHAPILGVTIQFSTGQVAGAKELRELFYRHPNVRLALSGHHHMIDDCKFDRVNYLCGGAVCGKWWEGTHQHFAPAFMILDLLPDGDSRRQMVFWEQA